MRTWRRNPLGMGLRFLQERSSLGQRNVLTGLMKIEPEELKFRLLSEGASLKFSEIEAEELAKLQANSLQRDVKRTLSDELSDYAHAANRRLSKLRRRADFEADG